MHEMLKEFPNIEKFIEEINDLKEASRLLEKVWLEVCPYGIDKLSDKTRHEINDYFKFDDSE